MNRKHVLGEINANRQNRHGLPLSDGLMSMCTSHRGTQRLSAAMRPVRYGEVPFHSLGVTKCATPQAYLQ